jgi:ATP phosphoribosyltransferase regulatory subunit HisZ
MTSVVLDAGALIAIERGGELVRIYLTLAGKGEVKLFTSSAVIAQAWRGGTRQARLARFLESGLAQEVSLDGGASRRIGALAALTGGADVVDGHVALIADDEDALVLSSDPGDLARWGVPRRNLVKT